MGAWKQDSSGARTYFLYDGSEPVCEIDGGSGAVTATNTFGANGLLSRHTSAGSVFYTCDASGNVAQRLDGSGAVASSDLYGGFGARQSTAATADVFGFSGQWGGYTDTETGLVLMTRRSSACVQSTNRSATGGAAWRDRRAAPCFLVGTASAISTRPFVELQAALWFA